VVNKSLHTLIEIALSRKMVALTFCLI